MKKDILTVICGTAVLAVVMVAVFYAIEKFDMTVLWGALLGFCCASFNFCLLAFTLSKSLARGKTATAYIGGSYLLRVLLIAGAVVFAIKSPHFNYVATVIPLIFPSVIITAFEGIIKSRTKSKEEADRGGRS